MKNTTKYYGGFHIGTWVKIGALGLLVGVGALIEALQPGFYSMIWQLATTGDLDALLQTLRSYGHWAIMVSLLLDILINMLGFLPSIFLSTANGIIFGIVPGILISWIGETIGVVISFWIMRYFLRHSAEKLIHKSNFLMKIDDFSGTKGFQMMLIARSIPYFPSGIVTALGAVSKINTRDYIVANLIGKLPSVALEVIVGHDIVTFQENLFRLTIVTIGAIIAYVGAWKLHKRQLRRHEKQSDDQEGDEKHT